MAWRTCDQCGSLMPPYVPRKRLGDKQVCEGCHMWAPKTAGFGDPEWYHAGTHHVRYKDDGYEGDHDIPAGAIVHKDVNDAWKQAIEHWNQGKTDFPRVYRVHSSNVTPQGSHAILNAPHEGSEVEHDHEHNPPLRSTYDEPDDPILFHGTTKYEGDDPEEITPSGGSASFGPGVASPEHAYATPKLSDAWTYAEKRAENGHGGRPTVYRVTPKNPHDVEKDPGWAGDYARANYEHDKRSPSGFDVLDEVPMSSKQEHEWRHSAFNDEADDDQWGEDDWHHEGALHNPTGDIRGQFPEAWYHGSPHEFEEFDPGGREHWNTYLGTHFSAQPEVAKQFASGGHHEADELDEEPAGHVVSARLHIKHPKTYRSEFDMDQAAHEWAHARGYLISKHIANHPEEYAEPDKDQDEDDWWNSDDYHDPDDEEREQIRKAHLAYAAREDKPFSKNESDFGFPSRTDYRPPATGWLNSHPQKEEIAEGFKNHLKKQGYDGIVYGNEIEGHTYDRGQKNLQLSPEPMAKPRSPGSYGHPQLDLPEVGEHNRTVPQHSISAVAFDPDQIEILRHHYKPEYKTWQERHPQDRQQPLPGMERNASINMGEPTDWDTHYEPGMEIHRGMYVKVPYGLYDKLHEPGAEAEAADVLAKRTSRRASTGMHWSTNLDQAKDFGDSKVTMGSELPVILHGQVPPRESIETRPSQLRRHQVFPYEHWEKEVPLRKGSPVQVFGISWKPHTPHPAADEHGWVRHDFTSPVQHTAATGEDAVRQETSTQDVWPTTTERGVERLCSYHRSAAESHGKARNELAQYFGFDESPEGFSGRSEKGSCAWCDRQGPQKLKEMMRPIERHSPKDSQQPRKPSREWGKRVQRPYNPLIGNQPITPVRQSLSSREEPWKDLFPTAYGPEGTEPEYYGTGIKQVRHSQDMPNPLYHGTSQEFQPGDLIEPGHPGNFVRRMKHVYATESPEEAQKYGWGGASRENGRIPRVYEVKPTGPYGHRSDAKGENWASEHPWQVVREVWNRPWEEKKEAMRKQAHDASENEDLRHCPFCGSGKIIGRADGTVECEFCHHYFTVQVQPQFPNFPQTMNGMPLSIPGMPGQVETPSGVGPNGEDMGEGMPPGGVEDGVPSDIDDGSDETEDSADTQAEPPPFAKASFKTVTGARLSEEDYVRHLAIALASDRDAMIAHIRDERGQ